MPQPIRGRVGYLVPPIGPKNTNVVEDVEILLHVNLLNSILFFQSARKTPAWWRTFRSCFLSSFVEFQLAVTEEKSKMSQSIRSQGGHLVFPIGPKTTNVVEDVEIVLPFKIR